MNNQTLSAAQPVICCVGESVAGQPTQFMIERAVSTLGLDWRALSVEVQPENFESACSGMLAMNFKGVRLLGSYQEKAVELLSPQDAVARFIGCATSASAKQGRWRLWNYLGFAWIDLLRPLSAPQPPIFWLHGDSPTTRSLFAALLSRHSDKHTDKHTDKRTEQLPWFWTDGRPLADIPPEVLSDSGNREPINDQMNPDYRALLSGWLATGSDLPSATSNQKPDSSANSQESSGENIADQRWIAYVTESDELPRDHLDTLTEIGAHLAFPKSLNIPSAIEGRCQLHVSASDLVIAGEAYDFHRWTGKTVDANLLRDAYDEYCDFW
jgi:hypothetical protein